jgi:hypothetical protein
MTAHTESKYDHTNNQRKHNRARSCVHCHLEWRWPGAARERVKIAVCTENFIRIEPKESPNVGAS